jgi:heme exporter protein A
MLEARDLAGTRGYARLFSSVTFCVEPGHALAVNGANGSGKTTLLRIIAGLSAPAAGAVRWNGDTMAPFDPRLRDAVVFHGHLPALKDELTAFENLASLVALAGAHATAGELAYALDAVALSRQQQLPARVLSQGQRRRIGLARLYVLAKPLWLLDEPATALDADGAQLLATMLDEHLAAGGTAIVATHQPLPLAEARTATLTLEWHAA